MKNTLTLFVSRTWLAILVLLLTGITIGGGLKAQGVTTSALTGLVTDDKNEPLIGATVVAVHTPSGTRYGTVTNEEGRYTLPAMRVGGPYEVTVSYIGYEEQKRNDLYLRLGSTANIGFNLAETAVEIVGVEVISRRNDVFSSERTGAATNITSQTISSFPTISRRLSDFTRLTPQANGNSFGGQDNRLNNITIDGSIFNNSFGLGSQPGDRTGTAPISLDAIEEITVNLAPYDVRQGGFVGAGINAVTRSGTNEFSGSVFGNLQNDGLIGKRANSETDNVTVTEFKNTQGGFRLGGPIIKNKLFFFVNGEIERRSEPFGLRANKGGETVAGNVTRVLASDLDAVSKFLKDNYNYETGPYEGYDLNLKGDKFLAKLDYNVSDNTKASVRYSMLKSSTDVLISNSSSLGFGNRRGSNSLSYQNSNYTINENIQSIIGEVNSLFAGKFSNNMILGYTYQNEDRGTLGSFFPLIEIQQGGANYISTGFEPFTPSNQLSYKTLQFQDNVSYYAGKHTMTAGLNLERISFRNVFFPGSQGVFVYSSLDDFYKDLTAAQDGVASDVTLRRFQYRYSALPGGADPVQPLRVTYGGMYIQDEWQPTERFNLTYGVRADLPIFDETGFANTEANSFTYRAQGEAIKIATEKLPDAKILWSPRVGFNYDVKGDRSFQLRGGTGIFTGRPAFVWISNQIGNNGVLTGFEQLDNTKDRPFTTDPGSYITNAAAPSSYELALTDPNFRFPQVWRSNFAVDGKLPGGIIGTFELIFNQNINAVNYLNINEQEAKDNFKGADQRPKYPGQGLSGSNLNNAMRINGPVVNAIYLTNTNKGNAVSVTGQLEKRFGFGLDARVAYTYGQARDLISAGSIASGSYFGNTTVNGNNYSELAFSNNDLRHRFITGLSYRVEYLNTMATQISFFLEARNQGRYNFAYSQDMNGDGINGNDLLYIPANSGETKFLPITSSGTTVFTPEQQAEAFNEYMRDNRGNYFERNGALLPWLTTADLSAVQEFYISAGGKRNTLQFRIDIFNFTNMLNNKWGVGRSLLSTQPVVAAGANADGEPVFRMRTFGSGTSQTIIDRSFTSSATINDVYKIQLGLRYIFN